MKNNDIVIGLLFGDEGKGATVDFLTSQRETNAVVRFSGGSQTAHNVITPDGRHHTFAQFGSGTFNGVRTILSQYMLINPFDLAVEGDNLKRKAGWNVFEDLLVSENALMTTPIHVGINRKREILRGASAHGSCGRGIGETQNFANQHPTDAPIIKDLYNIPLLRQKLEALLRFATEQVGDISDLTPPIDELIQSYTDLAEDNLLTIVEDERILHEIGLGYTVFEGSQGVLLDEDLGFHPHTTWSTTTQKKAQKLLADAGLAPANTIGAIRSYFTRHGHGPFPSEQLINNYEEKHNKHGRFQGNWRAGLFDMALFEYAVRANGGVDQLAVSHLDVVPQQIVARYANLPELPSDFFKRDRNKQEEVTATLVALMGQGELTDIRDEADFIHQLQVTASAPVAIKAYGPTWKDRVLV